MFLVSWIWFSMPYIVIARMGRFNNEKHIINDTLCVNCKWKGLQISVLQRLAFFVLMTLCCWQSKNFNIFHLIMFKFWYKARWKNSEYQLDINSIYMYHFNINFWIIAGPMVKCLKHCWSLCWKARHFYSSSRTWPLEWSRYGENTVYSNFESSLRQGQGRGGSKVTMEVKSLTQGHLTKRTCHFSSSAPK